MKWEQLFLPFLDIMGGISDLPIMSSRIYPDVMLVLLTKQSLFPKFIFILMIFIQTKFQLPSYLPMVHHLSSWKWNDILCAHCTRNKALEKSWYSVYIVILWVMTPCNLIYVVWLPAFWRNILPLSCTLKVEAIYSSETLVSTYQPTSCHNPVYHNMNFHHYGNLTTSYRI
jgi:hypothetical protein